MAGKVKAIGLFSGGLDSALAIKLIQEQGIEIIALNYASPFFPDEHKDNMKRLAEKLGVELHFVDKTDEYIDIVREPKHGHGKNINPCIDCKIFILKEAKKIAEEIGAKFIFTGEVVGQRPMSQHFKTLMLIEQEAGLAGELVRPLSGGILPETTAEKNSWVDRKKFLNIRGRSRHEQLVLADKYGLEDFLSGTSGCRLTEPGYAKRLSDLYTHSKNPALPDIKLLAYARHFRAGNYKILIGRNKEENQKLIELKKNNDIIFEAKDCVGPITLLCGEVTEKSIDLAAKLTARYCDAKQEIVTVRYGKKHGFLDAEIIVQKADQNITKKYLMQ